MNTTQTMQQTMQQMPGYRPAPASVSPSKQLRDLLDGFEMGKLIRKAAGDNKDQFSASVIEVFSQDKMLQECEPRLVILEAIKAATLHLPISKSLGYAYIVPYKKSVVQPDGTWAKVSIPTFIIGYKGLIQMAHRTKWYRHINADVIYEGELEIVNRLTGEISINPDKRRSDKVVGYFAYFESLYGFSKTLFMTLEDMAKYAKRFSKSVPDKVTVEQLYTLGQNDEEGTKVGWMGNFTEMAKKTVLRRLLSKWGYLSTEMAEVIASEEEAERNNDRESILETARADTQAINLDSSMYSEVQAIPTQTPVAEDDEEEDTSMATPQF